MNKITLISLITAITLMPSAKAAPAKDTSAEVSGAVIEQEVEDAINEIKKNVADFKKSHPDDTDTLKKLEELLDEATRIKQLNDARHQFSAAMKLVNDEQLKGIGERIKTISATADLQAALNKVSQR